MCNDPWSKGECVFMFLCLFLCLALDLVPSRSRNLTTPCMYGLTRKRRLKVSTWPPRVCCGPANNILWLSSHFARNPLMTRRSVEPRMFLLGLARSCTRVPEVGLPARIPGLVPFLFFSEVVPLLKQHVLALAKTGFSKFSFSLSF